MNDVTGFLSSILVTLITLLPIVNPLSTAVLLLGISEHLSKKDLNRQIIMACIYMTSNISCFLIGWSFHNDFLWNFYSGYSNSRRNGNRISWI